MTEDAVVSDQLPWLTEDEVRELTGYVRPSCQARWLRENRIKFWRNRLHRIVVPRDAVTGITHKAGQPPRTEPDFSKVS